MQIKTETKVGIFVIGAIIVFFYLSFRIGVFRLDRAKYKSYTVYFKDVSGLSKKAEVKIAGVKIGWVEDLELIDFDETQAKAEIMIMRRYVLHSDAYAVVRQEGFIGSTYLEILPGDPLLPELPEGASLSKPSVNPTSIDELLQQFGKIASNIEDVTKSLKNTMGGSEGKEQIKEIVDNVHAASENFATFSDSLDKTISKNEKNLNLMVGDLRDFAREIRENIPSFGTNIEKITETFDRDIRRLTDKIEDTAEALEEASVEARDGFKNLSSVAEKVDGGKGLLGKLINEDETYRDLKVAAQGLKNYFGRIDNLEIVVDSHCEAMYRKAEFYEHEDSKGYFDIRIHPTDDYFYQVQIMGTEKGDIKRVDKDVYTKWYDSNQNQLDTSTLPADDPRDQFRFAPYKQKQKIYRKRDAMKFGLQFGKTFRDIGFRFGLFENRVGVAVDYDIPFWNENLRWVTSLEMFDGKGRNRFDGYNFEGYDYVDQNRPKIKFEDRRPHLKWINKVYLLRNIYMTFGADDFISKKNANGFFGVGLRFGDDDLKYFISKLGVGNIAQN